MRIGPRAGIALALAAGACGTRVEQVASGDWNSVLTGRLDGWRAAVWMLGEHPFTGVGMGAYRTEFIPAKTALLRRGVAVFDEQVNIVFANAHNELLEVAAETGWPGLAGFGVLALANFPFRIAVALWPACLFLAWVFAAEETA